MNANGRYRGAGIGDYTGDGTTINISGGTVTSLGGENAAGIGKGYYDLNPANPTVLNLDGGTLTVKMGATAADGYDMNLMIKTTTGEAFSQGGTIKLGTAQSGLTISGSVLGIFPFDFNSNIITDGNTILTATQESPSGYFKLSPTETGMQLIRQADNLIWKYSSDTTVPSLIAGTVTRSSNTAANVRFTSNEWGQYYYSIVGDEASPPFIDTSGEGAYCSAAETSINLTTINEEAKDIYIAVKDPAGNVNVPLKIDIASTAYTVTYNGNGNTGGTVPTDNTNYHTSDSVTVKSSTGIILNGYPSIGWCTLADGSGTSYRTDDTFTMGTTNAALYAKWGTQTQTNTTSTSTSTIPAGTVGVSYTNNLGTGKTVDAIPGLTYEFP